MRRRVEGEANREKLAKEKLPTKLREIWRGSSGRSAQSLYVALYYA